MITIINNISKSLGVEIAKVFLCLERVAKGSKQSFSKARYKVDWRAFIDLNEEFVRLYYSLPSDDTINQTEATNSYRLYRDKYLLLATDGSDYELPYEPSLITEFGVVDASAKQPICMAKGVKIWDILNQITICSHLGCYDEAEIMLFRPTWQSAQSLLKQACDKTLLLLGDMHYPSFWLMYELMADKNAFLFRCRPDFCREVVQFMACEAQDSLLEIPIAADPYRRRKFLKRTDYEQAPDYLTVRAVKFTRPTGEQSCLITSLLSDTEWCYQDLIDLYPYRWGEEESYNFDKNLTQIENFSAKMPLGIRQDWYANTLMTNMAQLLIEEAQEMLEKEQENKDNKYHYKINRAIAIGVIKDEIPKVLFGKMSIQTLSNRLLPIILKYRIPVRPNRSFERKRKHKLKFSMNLRRCL